QASLQPRFHLELGLVRMVHAGRLLPIEQALAGLGGAPPPPPANPLPPSTAKAPPVIAQASPAVSAPQPASAPQPQTPPASDVDWKQRLHATLMEIGMPFTADGVEHSTVTASATELQFTTPEEFMLGMKADDL